MKWDKSDFEENYRFGLEMEFDVVPPGGIEVVPWPEGLCKYWFSLIIFTLRSYTVSKILIHYLKMPHLM